MDTNEALVVINKIKELWPKWTYTQGQVDSLVKKFRAYQHKESMRIIDDIYLNSSGKVNDPPIGKIINALSASALEKKPIERTEPKPGKLYGQAAFTKFLVDCLNKVGCYKLGGCDDCFLRRKIVDFFENIKIDIDNVKPSQFFKYLINDIGKIKR